MKAKRFFYDEDEKEKYLLFKNQINCQRILIFAPFMVLFMISEIFIDIKSIYLNIAPDLYYIYFACIESFTCLISIVIFLFGFQYKKNNQKYNKFFYFALIIYSILLIILSLITVLLDSCYLLTVDYNFFFFISLIICAFLYINPIIVIPEILISNIVLLYVIIKYKWYTEYSPYQPYCVFILITLCLCSLIRSKYLLDTLRREELINRYKENAEKENQLKSLFLANMSHEIRTPMNAIIGMSELALDFNLNDAEKNQIRQIRSSGISLLNIINDILDFSKIESGKLEIVPVEYNLLKTVYDSANVSKVKLEGKNVELIIEIDPSLSTIYYGDDLRINQILINLIGNAAKFTEKGHIIVRIEKNNDDIENLKFSVIDTGCGIKKEDIEKLFNAFQQVDMKMNRTKSGTGLGLSISKKLVQLMNGSMGVTSEYGKGSCFYFIIPQKSVSKENCNQSFNQIFKQAETNPEYPYLKVLPLEALLNKNEFASLFLDKTSNKSFLCPEAKILVVDDNDVNLQVAKGLLKKMSVIPDCSLSGYDALEKIKTKNYDIIYLDHQMPEMDGVETLQKMRAFEKSLNKKTTIIALSANAANGAKDNFLKWGFDDFVAKPVQLKDFSESLKKWLPSNLIQEDSPSGSNENTFTIPEGFINPDSSKIDLEQAIEFSGSFENWYKSIKLFAKNIENKSKEMQNYLNNNDYKNYTIQAHALKSSARIIGARELSEKAAELEDLGNKIQQVENKHQIMNDLLLSYIKIINSISIDSSPKNKEIIDSDELNSILLKIKEAANQNNLNEIEELFGKIKNYSIPENLADIIQKIEDAIENIDFETIENLIPSTEK